MVFNSIPQAKSNKISKDRIMKIGAILITKAFVYGSQSDLIWQHLETARATYEISDLHTSGNFKRSEKDMK